MGNVIDTILLLDSLGWVVHPLPIRLTVEIASDLKKSCERHLNSSKPLTIRAIAAVIGKIGIARFPGVMYGPLYYRDFEAAKSSAL